MGDVSLLVGVCWGMIPWSFHILYQTHTWFLGRNVLGMRLVGIFNQINVNLNFVVINYVMTSISYAYRKMVQLCSYTHMHENIVWQNTFSYAYHTYKA